MIQGEHQIAESFRVLLKGSYFVSKSGNLKRIENNLEHTPVCVPTIQN